MQRAGGTSAGAEDRLEFREVPAGPRQTFAEAVAAGLAQSPKSLPTRFLYDHEGSELFERITELPEYYPTRTERSILESHVGQIVQAAGENLAIIEFGSGSSVKTRLLLEAALARQPDLCYVPIDISADFLRESSEALLDDYPGLRIVALAAEYFDAIKALPTHEGPRLILFLGSNIGNLTHEEATDFLRRLCAALEPRDRVLIGVDRVKAPHVLTAAYNDRQGVTAEFNKNILRRIDRELDGDFDIECFRHEAPYLEREARVEMRLVSMASQTVTIGALGRSYHFDSGEAIHTEWSHKYTRETFGALASAAGMDMEEMWTDERGWFSLMMLRSAC